MRMLRALLAVLLAACAASAAAADKPQDFAWSLPIELDGSEGLHQLELDALVHQGAMQRDLADIRIFNAAGEAVPFAFVPAPQPKPAAVEGIALPFFPIRAARDARVDGLELKVQTRADGTVVGLSTQPNAAGVPERDVGILIDASALDQPLAALRVEWRAPEGGTHARVQLETSADLERWTTQVQAAPLVDLEFAGHRLRRDRIELAHIRTKYLRLSWGKDQPPLVLVHVWAEPAVALIEPPRRWRDASGKPAAGTEGGYEYDLNGIFPVDRLRFELPQPNTVARVRIAARDRAADPWRPVADGVVYRLVRGGTESESPDIAVAVTTSRYWRLEADTRGGGVGAAAPVLHAGWVPRRIVFAARGEGPFRLAFGNRDAKAAAYPLATLVPGYKAGDALELPQARLGKPAAGVQPAPAGDRPDYRKWTLWGALLAAVAILAAMAYRLVRQLNAGTSTAGADDAKQSSDPPARG